MIRVLGEGWAPVRRKEGKEVSEELLLNCACPTVMVCWAEEGLEKWEGPTEKAACEHTEARQGKFWKLALAGPQTLSKSSIAAWQSTPSLIHHAPAFLDDY